MKSRILIVEDERLVARELRLRLEDHGYRILASVATADDALTAASEQTPDLVLMDIQIQGERDGIEAATLLQQRFDVPVVFLTAHSDEATVQRAKLVGAAGYLVKPPKERELVISIEVALHRHEMARQLRQRERWFSTTLRSIGDAVVSTDPAGNVAFMNPVAELLTGWRAEDARGKPVTAIVRLAQTPATSDGTLIDLAGRQHTISDTTAPITDDSGVLLGTVLVFKDVTGQRQLERQLEAAERLASLGTLAAGVAHEINNPLTWIMANLEHIHELVETAPPSSELAALRDEVADARKGADRIQRIVRDLSVFSGRTPERETCQVAAAVRQAVANTSSPVAIALELDDAHVAIEEARLVQILTSLLSNAVHAIAEAPDRDHRIAIRTRCGARVATLEVVDTGTGIDATARPRIFEPFFTTKSTGKGTGLGLSISHGLITAVGGSIAVSSVVGEGTTFTVELPLAAAPTPQASPPPAAARARVLVIDDEEIIRRLIRRMLRDHEVTTASAPEALELLRAGERFDVVLCDLMMPDLTGMDLYEHVLALDPAQARRIVFLTGGAYSIRSAEFLASTTNTVLSKPFAPADLQALVRERAATPPG